MRLSIRSGITVNNILVRYANPKLMPYDWEILLELPSEDPGFIWDMEREHKVAMTDFHYQPSISFAGSKTECYTQLSEALEKLINV